MNTVDNLIFLKRRYRALKRAGLSLGLAVLGLTGCSALDVSNPLNIEGKSLDNATGAGYLWTVARIRFADATSVSEFHSGLISDEYFGDFAQSNLGKTPLIDLRRSEAYEATISKTNQADGSNSAETVYGAWQHLRRDATIAMPRVRTYGLPGAKTAHLGELFAFRGFSALRMAEEVCPGFPLRELDGLTPVFGPPLTTDQAFTAALADFDSALVYATDSARVLNLARLGKARALLGLGRFSEAGTVVAAVPSEYVETAVPTNRGNGGIFFDRMVNRISVANRKGGNGLAFVASATSGDPRIVLINRGQTGNGTPTVTKYTSAKYPDTFSPIVVASGVEARLITAEAQLHPAANPSGPWLATLNALRASIALPDTTDPGTATGRVDLLFRERALWLFATGHRLGDLRRLISRYNRAPETVFPTGTNRVGLTYGTATSLPFNPTLEHGFNSAVTGCTSR